MSTIWNLSRASQRDIAFVGAKAAALGDLLNAGFDVPDGFVLTVEGYSQLIERLRPRLETRVTAEAVNDPAEIESMAGEIREWIEQEPWPAQLSSELGTALEALSAGLAVTSFAARTSLPTEELATAFGSGVQRAVLGAVGLQQVEQGAAKCWGALWTSRSMYYRHRKKIPQTGVSLAVLIQPVVPADSAGIVITENPVTNDDDEMQIDSIWGLGAPLTQARVKPDRFMYNRRLGTIRERQIVDKAVRLSLRDDGALEQQVVEPTQADMPSISDEQVLALAEIAGRVRDHFGESQVIEWARIGNRFYVLQASPFSARRR